MKIKHTNNTSSEQLFGFCYEHLAKAHELFKQHYFECDFINRCSERRLEETGQCNLPYATLPDESALLSKAYELYCKMEDSNVAYNDTLDCVIDEVEAQIQRGTLICPSVQSLLRVCIVMEDGIVSAVYSSNPYIQIEITELDKNLASSEQREAVYTALKQDEALSASEYLHSLPGYEESDKEAAD